MPLGLCSLIVSVTVALILIVKPSGAVNGCTVTMIHGATARRKVLCTNLKVPIETIPKDLPQSTESLIIESQNITTINEADFINTSEMTSLQLTYSNLKQIHKDSFRPLRSLIMLDLSGNSLTISNGSLPVSVFIYLSELRYLKLTGNPLAFVPDPLFRPMTSTLRHLQLNKCDRPTLKISPGAFRGMKNMEELDLRDSGLEGLSPLIEADFRGMKSLKQFLVGGNKFLCDCNLRWLYFFLTQIQDTVLILKDGDKESRCLGPTKLLNRRFPVKEDREQLRYIDFVCPSRCLAVGQRQLTTEPGISVNLTCDCFTDPIQRLSWTKNGHAVEEMTGKYRLFQTGKETFQSTLNILSLEPLDSGQWACKLDPNIFQNFSLKVKPFPILPSIASINVYILVGLGSSLLLISLMVIVVIMFCRREALCQFHSQHPMVICGYETNMRKSSMVDGDLQYRYNQQDSRFNTSFYENTFPFDSTLSHFQESNHLFPEELSSTKSCVSKGLDLKSSFPKANNEKMLNMYCGCHYNSDDDAEGEMTRSSYSYRSKSSKLHQRESIDRSPTGTLSPEEKFQQLKLRRTNDIEQRVPNMKQCPFHGSSGTLTRVPGERPCPVHGSTATLPSRLSSKKVEHRFGCPSHNKDNTSVKSLKLDGISVEEVKPSRCKSVGRISSKLEFGTDKLDVAASMAYRPCPLHGDVLAAINENIFEPISKNIKSQSNHTVHKRIHSKVLQEHSLKIPNAVNERGVENTLEALKVRGNHLQSSSISISKALTSPCQSSLSSSPLLTSDVHGTLV